jgi:hypothetical protein
MFFLTAILLKLELDHLNQAAVDGYRLQKGDVRSIS